MRRVTISLKGRQHQTKNQIKILGIIFDTKLTWTEHVKYAIAGANKAKQALKLIAKYFTEEELLKLSTAYFYGRLYYGAKVWLLTTLNNLVKKMIWQASSRMLQIVKKDYNRVHSFESLHKQFKRASPAMWCTYVTACAMHDVVINRVPENVIAKMTINWLSNSRRRGMTFTRSNKLKIGFNCLSNRLQNVSTNLDVDWQQMSNTSFKLHCKRQFLNWAQ